MTHNEMVHGLCTQETITVQDFAELIRFTLDANEEVIYDGWICLLYTSPSPRDTERSRMPSSA